MIELPKKTGVMQAQERRAEQLARTRIQASTLLDTLTLFEVQHISTGTLQSILHILLAIANTSTLSPELELTTQHLRHSCHYLRQLITELEGNQDIAKLQHYHEECCYNLETALDRW